MLVLPIVNKNRVLNVEVTLRNCEKIRTKTLLKDTKESEILVNGKKISESIYRDARDYKDIVNFIRSNQMAGKRNYYITTKEERDSRYYDVYEVSPPPIKVNVSLDSLYGRVITDMRKEIPGSNNGKYLSFKEIGLDEVLLDDKIETLDKIVKSTMDYTKWNDLFEQYGVLDLVETVDFIRQFDCYVIGNTTVSEESIENSIKALSVINSKESRNLNKYYEIAKSNRDIYSKLSYVSMIVYGEPINLIKSGKERPKRVVNKEDFDYRSVAA